MGTKIKGIEYSKEELEQITTIYDKFGPSIAEHVKKPRTFIEIRQQLSKLMSRNQDKLQTNIVGRQLLVNLKEEKEFLDIFDLSHDDIQKAIEESSYFMKFGEVKLASQIAFALPLIIAAHEYQKIKKTEEAQICYLITFFKPYASRESLYFGKYPVMEDQMLYTIEHDMTEHSYIKKYGTVLESIIAISKSSFDNYLLDTKKEKLSDRELHVIYTSGVTSRINNFLGSIAEKYAKNKGKYLSFENNSSEFQDDEGSDIVDRDIASDAALRTQVITATLNKMSSDPVNTQLLKTACACMMGSTTPATLNMISGIIISVEDHMFAEMRDFFSAIIGSFLFTMNTKTGKKYSMVDFRTPVFPAIMSKKLYNAPNTSDANILKVKEMLIKMLETYSDDYMASQGTKRNKIKATLFFYWILLLQKAGR